MADDRAVRRADRGQVAARRRRIAAARREDESAVGVDTRVVAVVGRQTVEAGTARGDGGDHRAGAEIEQQRSARIAVAGVGVLARRTDRAGEVPAHHVGLGDPVRQAERTGGGLHQSGALDAVVVAGAPGLPEADDGAAGGRDGRRIEQRDRRRVDAGHPPVERQHRHVGEREAVVAVVRVAGDRRHAEDAGVLQVDEVAARRELVDAVRRDQEGAAADQRARAPGAGIVQVDRAARAAQQRAGGRVGMAGEAVDDARADRLAGLDSLAARRRDAQHHRRGGHRPVCRRDPCDAHPAASCTPCYLPLPAAAAAWPDFRPSRIARRFTSATRATVSRFPPPRRRPPGGAPEFAPDHVSRRRPSSGSAGLRARLGPAAGPSMP